MNRSRESRNQVQGRAFDTQDLEEALLAFLKGMTPQGNIQLMTDLDRNFRF